MKIYTLLYISLHYTYTIPICNTYTYILYLYTPYIILLYTKPTLYTTHYIHHTYIIHTIYYTYTIPICTIYILRCTYALYLTHTYIYYTLYTILYLIGTKYWEDIFKKFPNMKYYVPRRRNTFNIG